MKTQPTNSPWLSINLLIYLILNGLPHTLDTNLIKTDQKTTLVLKNYHRLLQLHGTGLNNQTRSLQLKTRDNAVTAMLSPPLEP